MPQFTVCDILTGMYTFRLAFQNWAALALFGLPALAQENLFAYSSPARFSLDEKGITLANEAVTFRIGGRLHVDPATGRTRPRLRARDWTTSSVSTST
jgi:hypothetical protein